jgi:hypothetical protein
MQEALLYSEQGCRRRGRHGIVGLARFHDLILIPISSVLGMPGNGTRSLELKNDDFLRCTTTALRPIQQYMWCTDVDLTNSTKVPDPDKAPSQAILVSWEGKIVSSCPSRDVCTNVVKYKMWRS